MRLDVSKKIPQYIELFLYQLINQCLIAKFQMEKLTSWSCVFLSVSIFLYVCLSLPFYPSRYLHFTEPIPLPLLHKMLNFVSNETI